MLPRHHCLRRRAPASPSRASCRKASPSRPPHSPPLGLGSIRTGCHQKLGMPWCDAESPYESARRQGMQVPRTARNPGLPPTTAGPKSVPRACTPPCQRMALSPRRHTVSRLAARVTRQPWVASAVRGEIHSRQQPPTDIECCDPFRRLKPGGPGLVENDRPRWRELSVPTGMRLKTRKLPGLRAICRQQGPDTDGGSARHWRTDFTGGKCEG